MMETSYDNREFKQVDFQDKLHAGTEFDDCRFINCSFANCNLSNISFIDCSFESCNLMMAQLVNTGMKSVKFKQSKLIGLDFSQCSDFLFQVEFQACQLDYALFTKKKMKMTRFSSCSLLDADFTESDLTEAIFDQCQLEGTTFFHTNLTKADLSSAKGFTIDPEKNRIRQAKFSVYELPGLLRQYNIQVVQ